MAGALTNASVTLNAALWKSTIAIIDRGVEISPKSVPHFNIIQTNGGIIKVDSTLWSIPLVWDQVAVEYVTAHTDLTAATDYRSALQGVTADMGILIDFQSAEIPSGGIDGRFLTNRVTQGVSDGMSGLESAAFSNGTGTAASLMGFRTILPMADTGAYYNIPSTRTNFTANCLHNWITTASRGARTSTLCGATAVVSDFVNDDDGILHRLLQFKDDAASRKYGDFVVYCTSTINTWLSKYLGSMNMLSASTVNISEIPESRRVGGITMLKVGGSYFNYMDMLFISTNDLYSTTYDAILVPFTNKGQACVHYLYCIPSTTGEKVTTQNSMFSVFPWQRNAKGVHYYAPIEFLVAHVITGLSGCGAIKGNGTYDSSMA